MDELEQQLEDTKLQLEETKLQLTDKLGTLEQQVSQTVETATSAVAATVEAVQGTVDSVTGAVGDAVHGMHDAFDLRHQIEKHPFLVLGGAVVVGYLAAGYFKTPTRNDQPQSPATDSANGDHARYDNAQPQYYSTPPQPTPQPAAPPTPSPLDSLKTLAISTLMGSMQGIAMRAIPEIVGLVVGNVMGQQAQQHREPPAQESPRARIWPEETPPFASSPPTEQHRSSKLS